MPFGPLMKRKLIMQSNRRVTRSSGAFLASNIPEQLKAELVTYKIDRNTAAELNLKNGVRPKKPAIKKSKAPAKKKRPESGRFRVAYTNRKAIIALSESGNNELSVDSMSYFTDEEKLLLSSWGLPAPVLMRYRQKGVTSLFQWQLECLDNEKVLKGSNILYSAPTSAGKTLVAELLMLKRVLELGKKAIFILPFVSVAREKMYSLQELFGDVGVRVEGFMGSYNPPGGFQQVDVAVCTIEKANSLINRLLEEGGLSQLGTVVVDELHLIGDTNRGYLLELLLTKIRFATTRKPGHRNTSLTMSSLSNASISQQESLSLLESTKCGRKINIQVIGMSATLPNLSTLAKWLDAELVISNFRPVPLVEHIKLGDSLFDASLSRVGPVLKDTQLSMENDPDHIVALTLETLLDGHSILTFCPSKQMCESTAIRIAREFFRIGDPSNNCSLGEKLRRQLQASKISEVLAQLADCPSGLDEVLRKSVSFGVAFHHAGLTFDERDIIESAFKRGIIRVMVATSTLSAGVNLPARRVLIVTPTFDGLDILTYRQMSGRAGRKGVDTQGESILICDEKTQKRALNLIQSDLPSVRSALFRGNGSLTTSLKRALLEVIASGVVQNPSEVEEYKRCTLLHHLFGEQNEERDSVEDEEDNNTISRCLEFLEKNDFIRFKHYESEGRPPEYMTTQLGSACLASSLSPDEGIVVFKELQKARRCFVLENELHVIYQVTPIYIADQWRNLDWNQFLSIWQKLTPGEQEVGHLIGIHESFILKAMMGMVSWRNPLQLESLQIHQRFFTALALNDLVNEMPISQVTQKYMVNKGVVQNLQQAASTFAGMVTAFCNRLGWSNLELLLSQFQERLQFGVQRELVDLVRLDLLTGQRARSLYNAGIKTIADLATSEPAIVAQILHQAGPFSSNVHGGQSRNIWMLGKHKAITESEAAQMIVQEARDFLQIEFGLAGVQFRKDDAESSDKENQKGIKEEGDGDADNEAYPEASKEDDVNTSVEPQKIEQGTSFHDVTSIEGFDAQKTPAPLMLRNISTNHTLSKSLDNEYSLATTVTFLVAAMKHSTPRQDPTNVDVRPISSQKFQISLGTRPRNDAKENLQEADEFDYEKEFLHSKFDSSFVTQRASPNGNSLYENEFLNLSSKFESLDEEEAGCEEMDLAENMEVMTKSFMDVSMADAEPEENPDKKGLLSDSILLAAADIVAGGDETDDELKEECAANASKSDSSFDCFPPSPEGTTPKVYKSPARSTIEPWGRPVSSASVSISEDEDDEHEVFIPTPGYVSPGLPYFEEHSKIHVFETEFKVQMLTKPELLPESALKSDEAIGLSINISLAKNRRTSGIGLRVLGKNCTTPQNRAIETHSLALCCSATKTIWVYEWSAIDDSGIKLILKKLARITTPVALMGAKEKLKLFLENTQLTMSQLPETKRIWDPKVAQWLLRFDEDRAISQDELIRTWVDASESATLQRYRRKHKSKIGKTVTEPLLAWKLMQVLKSKLEAASLWQHFQDIETPAVRSLLLMELNGFKLNSNELENLKKILEFYAALLELSAYKIAGRQFNLASSKDISSILRHDLGLGAALTTRSTAKQVLKKVNHEFARIILDWRKVTGALWKMVLPFASATVGGRVHGLYSHFTVTGRTVMAEPSLQCVPRDFTLCLSYSEGQIDQTRHHCRIKFGNKVALLIEKTDHRDFLLQTTFSPRRVFVPTDGFVILSADYSQMELRILAHVAKEQKLLAILNRPEGDVFREIAAEWKCIHEGAVTDDMRQEAKGITYGLIYGMGAKTLADQLEVDESEAAEFIRGFMWAYPGIRTFIDQTVKSCKEVGYVETISGRRRYLEHINSKNAAQRAQAERQAVNSRIQGSASDLVKKAMTEIQAKLSSISPAATNHIIRTPTADVLSFPVLNLHDELIYEVRESHLPYFAKKIKSMMENSLQLDVRTPVLIKYGPSWGQLEPYKF